MKEKGRHTSFSLKKEIDRIWKAVVDMQNDMDELTHYVGYNRRKMK